uniref:C2H2-type domain-containing protein n=1 Tax=Ditylenchus dipsaci TaxID=166011 RepID=A0A915CNB0_9BILA
MSLNYQKDPTTQYPTLPTGLDGADSVVRFFEQGTDEVKNLLKNECSVIFECSYCRSLFRSIINFVSHKRTICRSLQTSVRLELELGKQVSETIRLDRDEELDTTNSTFINGTSSSAARSSKRNPTSLRRVNLASVLGKHIQNFNVPLPEANTSVEMDDRWWSRSPTTLPSKNDNTIRYGEMKLRNRKATEAAVAMREMNEQEIKIIENVPQHIHEHADFHALKCLSGECADIAAFPSMEMFAYHLAIYHRQSEEDICKCYICGAEFKSLRILNDHFKLSHKLAQNDIRTEGENAVTPKVTSTRKRNRRRVNKIVSEPAQASPSPAPVSTPATPPAEDIPISSSLPNVELKRGKTPKSAAVKTDSETPITKVIKRRGRKVGFRLTNRKGKQSIDSMLKDSLDASSANNLEGVKKTDSPTPKNLSPVKVADSKFRAPFSQESSSGSKNDFMSCDEAREIDKLLNSTNPEETGNAQSTPTTTNSTDVTPDREIPVLHNDMDMSNIRNEEFSSEEEDEATPSKAPKLTIEDPAALRRQTSRKRKPTKRIFNEEFVVSSGGDTNNSAKKTLEEPPKARGRKPRGRNSQPSLPTTSALTEIPEDTNEDQPDLYTNTEKTEVTEETLLQNQKAAIDKVLQSRKRSAAGLPVDNSPSLPVSTEPPKTPLKSASEPPDGGKSMDNLNNGVSDQSPDIISVKKEEEAESQKDFVVPPSSSSSMDQLPSVLADRYRENLAFYTPRARKTRINEETRRLDEGSAAGSSRRKQNLLALKAAEVGVNDSVKRVDPPEKPADLTDVPVYLTEVQRDIFFAPLRPMYSGNAPDGGHQCSECGDTFRSIRDGRRHMVGHLRIMRIRCSLCDAGAFFCSDMRIHLMFRHCEKLNLAPEGFVSSGEVPCMDKKKADALSQLVDPFHPGRVMYTSGKIVSWANPKAYYPDPK